MAQSRQAIKRHRNSVRKQVQNKSVKSAIKTSVAKVYSAAKEQKKEEVNKLLSEIFSKIDKAFKYGVLHKNLAARKKSRITKAVLKTEKTPAKVSKKKASSH